MNHAVAKDCVGCGLEKLPVQVKTQRNQTMPEPLGTLKQVIIPDN